MRDAVRSARASLALRIVAALGLAATLSACSAGTAPRKGGDAPPGPAVPPGGVLLQGAGATFPSPLYEEWFRRFHHDRPMSVIAYEAVGSGEGIRRFIGREVADLERVDFAASDAALRDDEIAMVPSGALMVPITAGSVALAYNLPDVAELRLSRQAYTALFLGQIKNWNDPRIARTNPRVKLPNLTVTTVVRQDGSGTTFAFTKHLDAVSDAWRSQFGATTLINWPGNSMRATGNEGVAARITQSIGSIGYVSYEFARKAGLRVAMLENHAGNFVGPTDKNSSAALIGADPPDNMRLYIPDPAAGQAYPIVTLTWILLYRNYGDAHKGSELYDLFRWCLTDGQQYAGGLGYIPLPPNIARRSLEALEGLRRSPSD
jgi:phosphate transport system substrate-binding protein